MKYLRVNLRNRTGDSYAAGSERSERCSESNERAQLSVFPEDLSRVRFPVAVIVLLCHLFKLEFQSGCETVREVNRDDMPGEQRPHDVHTGRERHARRRVGSNVVEWI